MTAQISAYGRLVADPQTRTTTNGNNMAMARLAVSLPCNAAEAGELTFWLGVIAFGKQADALAKHQKGDLVSVAGNMKLIQWAGQDGGAKQGNSEKLLMLCVGPVRSKHLLPNVKSETRCHRMTMISNEHQA